MNFPVEYVNGSYTVKTTSDGTQVITDPTGKFEAVFPDTIDLKVTNQCNVECTFCHENSTRNGKHAQYDTLCNMLERFPAGIELAIGGGNPLAWPGLDDFLKWAKDRFICNITVNGVHMYNISLRNRVRRYVEDSLIHGVGVSNVDHGFEVQNFGFDFPEATIPRTVGHIIPALWDVYSLEREMLALGSKHDDLATYFSHYLVLGFKRFGRGTSIPEDRINHSMDYLRNNIARLMIYMRARNIKLSFDNLAIAQLNLRSIITDEAWASYFMGEDGTRSMFIDAVKQTSALSSTSLVRMPWYVVHPLDDFKDRNVFLQRHDLLR